MQRGLFLLERNDPKKALDYFDQHLEADSADVRALRLRARALGRLGRHEEALRSLDQALTVEPNDVAVLIDRGDALQSLGRFDESLAEFGSVMKADPKNVSAAAKRAYVLNELERYEEALASVSLALSIDTAHVDALNTRGLISERLGHYDQALADFDKILSEFPNHADALNNRGLILARTGRFEDALACFDKTLSHYPGRAQAFYNRSIMRLALGDFARGFREFESRWEVAPLKHAALPTPAPLWLGQAPLEGKTIFLYHEQGYGDTLQFVRYVPLLIQRGARVILAVPPALRTLMETLPGPVKVVTQGNPMVSHDFRCPLMSLPLAFGTSLKSLPAQIPYLSADRAQVQSWKERLGRGARPKIGLVWAGRRYPPVNHPRDMPLTTLLPLLELNADFISLQKEIPEEDRHLLESLPKLARHGELTSDFADTAALIENLDVVITVDTSVAHLAGALGKPVWIMNRYATCWRWLSDRADSPWYPSARLFRQKSLGEWTRVVAEVVEAAETALGHRQWSTSSTAALAPVPEHHAVANDSDSAPALRREIGSRRSMEKIRFVCATRMTSADFFSTSALGRSLVNFRSFPKGQPIDARLFPRNEAGLSSVYNIAIEESKTDPAILVFIHDDVLLCDFYWAEHLLQALQKFQIVGLSGNKRRVPKQPSWMYLDDKFTCDSFEHFSGVIGHGDGLPGLRQLSVYGAPLQEVKLLDGVMLATRSQLLLESDLRFDPRFDFDFYDVDFCRQAEIRKITMGTCAISVVHQSVGRLGGPRWLENYSKYLLKYGE